jgi:guanine deaminase
MADAYKIQALQGTAADGVEGAARGDAAAPLPTRASADEIGQIEPGKMADLTVWDWAHGPVATHRYGLAHAWGRLHERVFTLMTLGDERNLVTTFVAGRVVFERRCIREESLNA